MYFLLLFSFLLKKKKSFHVPLLVGKFLCFLEAFLCSVLGDLGRGNRRWKMLVTLGKDV